MFEFTPKDLADVIVRDAAGTRSGRSTRRKSIVAAGVVAGGAALLVFVLLTGLRDAMSLIGLAMTASLVGGVVALYQAQTYESALRRCLVRQISERLGAGPMRCEVELRQEGVWVRQRNVEVLYAWTDLMSIDDATDGVSIRFRDGYVMVRSRAFAADAERAAFLRAAREHQPVA